MESDRLTLTTADGVALAAEVSVPTDATAAAVLAHPHPQMGGDMHAPVITSLLGALPHSGVGAVRFDFRGGGSSGGSHGGGTAEVADVEAAIDEIAGRCPDRPVWLVGYSFGAGVVQQVLDPRVAGWVLIAFPVEMFGAGDSPAGMDPRPTHLVIPEHDQFSSPEQSEAATAGWQSTTAEVIGGCDHFLAGRVQLVTERVVAAITSA